MVTFSHSFPPPISLEISKGQESVLLIFVTLAIDPEYLFPEGLVNYKHACLICFVPQYELEVLLPVLQ